MTRPCASCGLFRCDGVACFVDEPDERDLDAETQIERDVRASAFWERLIAERLAEGLIENPGDPMPFDRKAA